MAGSDRFLLNLIRSEIDDGPDVLRWLDRMLIRLVIIYMMIYNIAL